MADTKVEVDENSKDEVYNARSRDAAALGFETIKRVGESNVLIIGLKGVGVETAKNIILNGPKKVSLYDNEKVAIADLGTNFYLTEKHVGVATRAEGSLDQLQGLNDSCIVEIYKGSLESLDEFDFIVVTVYLPKDELIRLNKLARARKPTRAAFIWTVTTGTNAFLFSDFGPEHSINDPNGNPVTELVVSNIQTNGVVTVTAARHGLTAGDYIKFSELEGPISNLNGVEKIKIKDYKIHGVIKGKDGKETRSEKPNEVVPNKFVLDLSESSVKEIGEWKNGGLIKEVKPIRVVKYLSLEEALSKPADFFVPHIDSGLWFSGRGNQLHLATLALLRFVSEKKELPALHGKADAQTLFNYAKEINEAHVKANAENPGHVEVKEVEKDVIEKVSHYARTELSGYAAFLGGLAAQELVKLWGKYTPVNQWLYSDHFNLLQAEPPVDAIPQNSRYDHQISIFGKAFQQRLSNQRWFMVGVGALGCEYLKAYALMGLGTGPKGGVHITDNDNIELSNLSRQFLFRRRHVTKAKATIAAQEILAMNPQLTDKITVHLQKVWPGSEDLFNDKFWDSLDGVWNALDNIQARQYTDSKCLLHSLPLLESGTQGTGASTDVILPFKTASYQDMEAGDTGGIPACTLKNFPSEIDHCIEWARPQFFELFEHEPENYNLYVENPDKFFEQIKKTGHVKEKLEKLEKVKRLAEIQKKRTMGQAITLALERFDHEFRVRIKDLVHFFPEDHRLTDSDTKADLGPFWSGAKRFPRAAEFSADDQQHFDYVYHTSQLFAYMLEIKEPVKDEGKFRAELAELKWSPPEWKAPSSGKPQEIEETDVAKPEEETEDDEAAVSNIIEGLKKIEKKEIGKLIVNQFEKDDDKNHHIDFLTACSNIRAWNYKIQLATRAKVKVKAGRIIPALATTTAATTGLMTLEFYKLILGYQYQSQTKFRNSQIDFANSTFNFWEPGAIKEITTTKETNPETKETTVYKAFPSKFSTWDKIVVKQGNLTVKEFAALFPSLFFGVQIVSLFKFGFTESDIKSGKGKLLYGHTIRSTKMFQTQLAKKNLSENLKKKFEDQLKQAEDFNRKINDQLEKKLVDVYVEEYGALISPERSYVLLSGVFKPAEGQEDPEASATFAKIPVIQFYFKDH